ncbi:MAG: stage III sporulation protein AG [Oscillospiraceae bacterium]|jgi:stage III sporulation protein AG|nr:stage III sporulation protein AG [Oscillospiraceae bacterium]
MANDEGKRKLTAPLAVLNKYKYVLLVAAIGAALLLWPGTKTESSPAESGPSGGGEELSRTEEAMEEILGKISGVGRVDVMLTLHSGSELVLAEEGTLRYSGDSKTPDSYERSNQPVTDSGGVVVTQEKYPQYRGALVVCDGGGNDSVRLQIIHAVSALTGLGSDRIAVVKWGAAELSAGSLSNSNQTIREENQS